MINQNIGRNDPCSCGSGKKYKRCCLLREACEIPAATSSAMIDIPGMMRTAARLLQAGSPDLAEVVCRDILQVKPRHADALHLSGVLAMQRGDNERAAELIGKAIKEHPSSEMYCNHGAALKAQYKLDAAVESYRKAISLNPNYAAAYNNLGNALREQGKLDAAIESLHKAISLDPADAEAHSNLANALKDQGKLDAAVESYRKALSLAPDSANAHYNLGVTLTEQGKLDEGIQHYQRILALAPNNDYVHYHLGVLYLLKGDLKQGWAGYEYRWIKQVQPVKKREFAQPWWQGESLEGKTILVWGEQGIGDEIMFSSCLPQIVAASRHCVIECSAKLERLLRRSFPTATVRAMPPDAGQSVGDEETDLQIAMGSVPQYLRQTYADFPRHSGYLKVDPERVELWRGRLAALGSGLKVGISWQGGTVKTRRAGRSLALAQWLPILRATGVNFVNLQYTDCSREIAGFKAASGIELVDWQEVRDDYEDTAALVSALDLVISVCTAVVHLGGALGKPVWVMAPYSPEWRYGIAGEKMPWYPSVTVFRQPGYGEWAPVIERVADELRQRAGTPAQAGASE
jgi:Flp pilus assembly protein TadD